MPIPSCLLSFRSAFCLAMLLGLLSECSKDQNAPAEQTGDVYLELEPVVGAAPLALNTTSYPSGNGDTFTVSVFKYYLSNITLQKADGTVYTASDSYYLIDAAQGTSQHFAIKQVPVGTYTGISFTVGVDSARNVAGAQTGPLDPINGMFWDWNSGYIFVRLQGTSPQSPTGGLLFAIMGFQKPYSTLRTISPSFHGATLAVDPAHNPEVHIEVDVQKMFAGPKPIRFADVYDSEGGPSSMKVADNYAAGMFSVEHIHAN